ncbi:hypothetical protein [Thalassovita sp.]|uniref:hypothetical protein n=1 Tax=Thalassovita sp. TaxID=1979401 RepID=UPI002B2737C3|nr:hypothetical protein [Thalassovita sp.]
MSENEVPKGQRFSLLYLSGEETLSDCPRMRRRLGALADELLDENDYLAGKFLEAELGISIIRSSGMGAYVRWVDFFEEEELADVLDAITLIFSFCAANRLSNKLSGYRSRVQRIFNERNMRYRVDDHCGVHPHVDTAFEQVRTSAISGLGKERFNAARAHLESVEQAMMREEPDNRQAIRSVFDAAENIFKMMFKGVTHINNREINNRLPPQIEALYAAHPLVKKATLKQCESFKSWVEGAHFYRHADDLPEPAQPPRELTVLMVSQGYGWVRWLAELDQNNNE